MIITIKKKKQKQKTYATITIPERTWNEIKFTYLTENESVQVILVLCYVIC